VLVDVHKCLYNFYRLWPVRSIFDRKLSASAVRSTDAASIEGLSQPSPMRFSEADAPWQPIPSWADFLIRCGFAWADGRDRRRISVVSMPCESAGAGLVALGAIRRRLALDDANDSLSHFQRIEKLAGRREGETFLRHHTIKGRFRLDGKDQRGLVWVRREPAGAADNSTHSGPPRVVILSSNANEWRFEREAPTQAIQGAGLPYGRFYEELIEGATAPLESNLKQSDSGICLAGRVTGESASRSVVAALRFESHGQVADLAQLLTVHRWSPDTVSRVAFFNSRTGQLDRSIGSTDFVVADGDLAFLKVLEAAEFRHSDVVGVIHRAVERDRLESVGTKLADLAQWYVPDRDMLDRVPPAPIRVTVSAQRRS
jgi:hypothetical protein